MSDAGVDELFRFRSVRHISHITASPTAYVISSGNSDAKLIRPLATDNFRVFCWIQQVSEGLMTQSDYLSPDLVIAILPADWETQIASLGWADLRAQLHQEIYLLACQLKNLKPSPNSYGLAVVPADQSADLENSCRTLLVYDLIVTLAADQKVQVSSRQLKTSIDIQTALSFRNVVLPVEAINKNPPVLARRPGVTDLQVVNNEWNRYIAGELANVVNVMPAETIDEKTLHLEKTVSTTSTSDEQTTSQSTTNSQTTSQTLSQSSTSAASMSIGAHAQVELSGAFGPMQIKSNIGAEIQTSQSSSNSIARTTAEQTVASAVKSVSETITRTQTDRTTIKDTGRKEHKLENKSLTEPIVGLYRWLSVVHRCQLVTYPNRLVLEFEIPEPGRWLRWALKNQPDTPWSNPDPGPFTMDGKAPTANNSISTSTLNETSVQVLASRWRVQGLPQPPPANIAVGRAYSLPTAKDDDNQTISDNTIVTPDGYEAFSMDYTYSVISTNPHTAGGTVIVGASQLSYFPLPLTGDGHQNAFPLISGDPPVPINSGTIPVAVDTKNTHGGTINITIHFRQQINQQSKIGLPFMQWQQNTFDQLVGAYNTLLSNFHQERLARAQQQSGPMIVGPPELNLARCVGELKKLVTQDMLGQPFLPPSLWRNDANGMPSLDPQSTVDSAPVIQFFEQAFEWENLVYICYPYFWGSQDGWIQNATWASSNPSDPVFDQFLTAGSARVVVPARPGFECLVNWFLYTSQIWGGQKPPGPNDPDYLSVADEIEAIQIGATDGKPTGSSWEVTLPTTYLWIGTDETALPKNGNATIPAPTATTRKGRGHKHETVASTFAREPARAVGLAPRVPSEPIVSVNSDPPFRSRWSAVKRIIGA